MKTISLDLRERILAVYDEGGQSYRQIARRFKVSHSLVGKLVGQRARTGGIESLAGDWRRRSLHSWDRRRICRAAWAGVAALMLHALVDFHLRIPTVGLAFLAMLATALQAPDWPRAGGKSAAGEWESDDLE